MGCKQECLEVVPSLGKMKHLTMVDKLSKQAPHAADFLHAKKHLEKLLQVFLLSVNTLLEKIVADTKNGVVLYSKKW